MFGSSRYLGLKGLKLNVAIGVIAGLDFLWVLYDLVAKGLLTLKQSFRV